MGYRGLGLGRLVTYTNRYIVLPLKIDIPLTVENRTSFLPLLIVTEICIYRCI